MPSGRLNTCLVTVRMHAAARRGSTAVPFSLIAMRRGEQSIFSEATRIRGFSALPQLPPAPLLTPHPSLFSFSRWSVLSFIECNFTTAYCGQILSLVCFMCSSSQGYFLLCNSMKRIPYNYKCLIFPDSSNISLRPSP